MQVVVTGASGNVGQAVLAHLVADPEVTEIKALARRMPDRRWPKTTFRQTDITADDLTAPFRGADVVVHLAWLFQPTHRPQVTWDNNVGGTVRVLRAVAEARVPALVYASSVGAYSPGRGPVDETWPTHALPVAAYGREKSYVERLLDSFEKEQPSTRVVRMRTAFIFQTIASTQQRRLFGGPFLPASLLRLPIPLVPFPAGLTFQAVHASDVGAAYGAAVTRDVNGAFNVAAEPVLDAVAVAAVLGGRPLIVHPTIVRAALAAAWHAHAVPAEPGLFDLALSLPTMRTDRARSELEWKPRISGPDALAEAVRGMRNGEGGDTPPLEPDSARSRAHEVMTGVGQRP